MICTHTHTHTNTYKSYKITTISMDKWRLNHALFGGNDSSPSFSTVQFICMKNESSNTHTHTQTEAQIYVEEKKR